MANYNLTLTVQAGKGSSATFSAVNGSGLTSGNPLDLQIGDTVTFIRSGVGAASFSGLSIFTNNANFTISHGGANVVRTVASGIGTTADSITGENNAGNATDTFFFERQGLSPSYNLGTVSNMNEGASQTITVNTANVANGTTLYFTISPAGQDFNSTSGSFTINSNTGSFTITTLSDSTTEGSETKTLSIRTGSASGTVVASQSFTVFDTSTTPPTFTLGNVSNMNEGATQSVTVTTTNFGSGTLYWTIDGSGEFTAHSGSVSISSNSGTFSISSIADQTTEGNETKYLRLRTGSTSGTNVSTRSFTLIDTSTAAGGSGSGGTGTGGSTTGSAGYGVAVYGPNGSTVVFGSNLRTQSIVFSTTISAVSGTTYGPYSVADANDTNKIQIFADYQTPNTTATVPTVSGSQIIITKSSTGFTFRHTASGTKTFALSAVKIA